MKRKLIQLILMVLLPLLTFGGNPDRQGEAGARELLLIPWAKSAGMHNIATSMIRGIESMRLNVAGLSGVRKTDIALASARYLVGTDLNMHALGLAQRTGENSVIGLTLMAMDFGDIDITTYDQPEGIGATYSPNFFNIGLGYAYTYENKISVGATLRIISESISDLSAIGVALDAGVQYVNGPKDNFKFGVSVRNVGTPMRFGGEGLSSRADNPTGSPSYELTYNQRAASFEIPSLLNIGLSYDFYLNTVNRLSVVGNFTSNSFSRDEIGAGIEYCFNDIVSLRGSYKIEVGQTADGNIPGSVYDGLSAGLSLDIPFGEKDMKKLGIDYAYRTTNPWNGTHNLTLRLSI
ncbi:PorV/PorQ family protein [Membranihabitans maritimus]|uniref:PorV/PorQ family protein n=1 Tax=Membranihabitans maritimus TaxID=2904244 RepID=UPI001F1CA95A|nr:PorV/PorQ family protein [Membranihabitans maritimus]